MLQNCLKSNYIFCCGASEREPNGLEFRSCQTCWATQLGETMQRNGHQTTTHMEGPSLILGQKPLLIF